MIIHSADFSVSNTDPSKGPTPAKPEFAFIGRSNVGKSSLINALVSRKNLALTSSKPGKTQTINHFFINKEWYLVDLPGYGFATTTRSKHRSFGPMIETYLKKGSKLVTTFVLLDPRHAPQAIDIDFIHWMGESGLPFALVFTKIDKISKNELMKTQSLWESALSGTWEEMPPVFFTSSEKKTGMKEILTYIQHLLKDFYS
ncbi:MAG TPA: ribosome biogenesis GTP-binding protein YihA/YsxC [Cyclobacteriaceae bacterium]|nr:ribosome biogenesis GTP-binding protein YihA/YsxC [Cyclobacteriaceae bacterium]